MQRFPLLLTYGDAENIPDEDQHKNTIYRYFYPLHSDLTLDIDFNPAPGPSNLGSINGIANNLIGNNAIITHNHTHRRLFVNLWRYFGGFSQEDSVITRSDSINNGFLRTNRIVRPAIDSIVTTGDTNSRPQRTTFVPLEEPITLVPDERIAQHRSSPRGRSRVGEFRVGEFEAEHFATVNSFTNYLRRSPAYFSTERDKPFFTFCKFHEMNFDLEHDKIEDLFTQIKINVDCAFTFITNFRGEKACGPGATRQVYLKMLDEMMESFMTKTSTYFMDINLSNEFWSTESNIKIFVDFIAMTIQSGCLLPYHFIPTFLEILADKSLNMPQLEFFMEKIDPESLASVKKIDERDFDLLDSGFDTIQDFYLSKIRGAEDDRKKNIYLEMKKYFAKYDNLARFDIETIDMFYSGPYTIDGLKIIKMLQYQRPYMMEADTFNFYVQMFNDFILSLNEIELKSMLVAFGNTTSLDKNYSIYFSESISTDIHIQTCMLTISLNMRLFKSPEILNELRYYFQDKDQISDGSGVFQGSIESISIPPDIGAVGRGIRIPLDTETTLSSRIMTQYLEMFDELVSSSRYPTNENDSFENPETHIYENRDDLILAFQNITGISVNFPVGYGVSRFSELRQLHQIYEESRSRMWSSIHSIIIAQSQSETEDIMININKNHHRCSIKSSQKTHEKVAKKKSSKKNLTRQNKNISYKPCNNGFRRAFR